MAYDGLATSQGIGTGEAQVFNRFQDPNAEARLRAGEMDQQKKAAEKQAVYGEIPRIGKDKPILDQHTPYFIEHQKQIYNFAKANIDKLQGKNFDPQKHLEFQQMLDKFVVDANRSAAIAKKVYDTTDEYAKNTNKYRPEYHDYLSDYLENKKGLDENGEIADFDATQLKENFDPNQYLHNYVVPESIGQRAKTTGYYTNPVTGDRINTSKEEFTPKQAEELAARTWLNDPVLRDGYQYNFSKLPAEQQKQYGSPENKYLADVKQATVFHEAGSSYGGNGDGSGYDKDELTNLLNTTSDFNVNTGSTYASKKGYTQTGTMVGYVPPKKPIAAATVSGPDVWDMDKGDFIKSPGVQQVTLAGLASVPVLTQKGADETGSKAGSPATKEFLANLEKAGKNKADYIQYETKAHGTYGSPYETKAGTMGTEDRNVLYPGKKVANSFGAQGKDLYQAVEENTKRLNEQLRSGTTGTTGTTTPSTDINSLRNKYNY